MQDRLADRLRAIAAAPRLMVACDYDGTLAEIVPNPALAFPNPAALNAFRALGELPLTTTAIVSGRALASLAAFVGTGGPEVLVGSHGAEWQRAGVSLTDERRARLIGLSEALDAIAEGGHGLRVEVKPAGVALHFRTAEQHVADAAVAASLVRCGGLPGVYVRHGSAVVEFMVVPANKGDAVARAKQEADATGVVFIGDDLTDEDVFQTLSEEDLAVKVGIGGTLAPCRVTGISGVTELLENLASVRVAWLRQQVRASDPQRAH